MITMRSMTRFATTISVALFTAAITTACTDSPTDVEIDELSEPADPAVLARAVRVDIDLATGTATVTPPRARLAGGPDGPSFAILGSNEVAAYATIVGRRRWKGVSRDTVFVEIVLENRLTSVDLGPPIAGFGRPAETGLRLLSYRAIQEPDGAAARPTNMWNGDGAGPGVARHNILTNQSCTSGRGCVPWVQVAPIAAGQIGTPVTVGFTITRRTDNVTLYLLVEASFVEHALPPNDGPNSGALAGIAYNAQGRPFAGVAVQLLGRTVFSDADGLFSLGGLPAGDHVVWVESVPAACSAFDPRTYTNVRIDQGRVTRMTLNLPCS